MRYEFFTFKPDESNTIDLESFLMSILTCMHGAKSERYIKRIKKVAPEINSAKKGNVDIRVSE